jgi:CheY-like chemotaxis protein
VAKRGKVLVVDDEPAIRDLFTEYLTQQGFEVVTAEGGAEALTRLAGDRPDIVLLDVRMPGIDGIETLRRIRGVNMRVPVLMISANDDVAAAKEALSLGAFDYAIKPVDFDFLGRALDKMAASLTPVIAPGGDQPAVAAPSSQGLLYDLALAVFRITRALPPAATGSIATALETAALSLVQRGAAAEKTETVRALNQIRALLRFAKDLGDITDETHRTIEGLVARARGSVGLS